MCCAEPKLGPQPFPEFLSDSVFNFYARAEQWICPNTVHMVAVRSSSSTPGKLEKMWKDHKIQRKQFGFLIGKRDVLLVSGNLTATNSNSSYFFFSYSCEFLR